MLEQLEQVRIEATTSIDLGIRSRLGQFLTPATVARFMASLFPASNLPSARLLDAGAGIGSLTGAFLDRWAEGAFEFREVTATAYEIDDTLRGYLTKTLEGYAAQLALTIKVLSYDFIEDSLNKIQFPTEPRFTHAILNPPYKKIHSNSRHRRLLSQVGIETVNIYSAFVALAVELMETGGQIVAIIPRSFCNGPYYRPFREFVLARAAIRHIHLFESRNKAFKDDGVLQENIIIRLECGGQQGKVTISTSTDDTFTDYQAHAHPFERIVMPYDRERFVHIPTSLNDSPIELSPVIRHSLADLGIEVSTGPVVDFRMREHLREMPEPGTVPLLYSVHFAGLGIEWPKMGIKKPNAIMRNAYTEKWLYPTGFYVVTRRFSSKEEKRRIVANVVAPEAFPDALALGFENHLNVFHACKKGLPEDLVRGLAVFLNSRVFDNHFRLFSGHTQVNATDLRQMKYPSHAILSSLGSWAKSRGELTQAMIDTKIENHIL
ncbi:MAG: SAM-dependent methyltransferase [Desulfarculus sp.]|jgi:tRNA1(Val) A37 N6-methylase TrmN6|nr:MAG: SAM-dependent methyltransferase [Desulfarculus sp.]